jgi:DNA (cytosine-5)-methyltransferase 1
MSEKIVALFSGAGGLDLGFKNAGFDVVWANEYDKEIWETFSHNQREVFLDKRSITDIPSNEIPECDGIIGGPPCQSWSEAGTLKGIDDERGQLFYEFIRILRDKKPKFFLVENVSGMLAKRHSVALENIKSLFVESGYDLFFQMLNVCDYEVPQDRKRVIFIGFRSDLNIKYEFPSKMDGKKTLKDAIWDLRNNVVAALDKNTTNYKPLEFSNHEYMIGGFSSMFMSRNRVRGWDERSFTIQAGARHAPIHPQAPKMPLVEKDIRIFEKGKEHLYRRLSVRECARIQTFPDSFQFCYTKLSAAYKMIGNAVPVKFAYELAHSIKSHLDNTT